jgi:hypothetical protein
MGIGKRLEDHLAAAAFAEAGEFDTAREILEAGRKVVLGLQEERLQSEVLGYALNLCQRVNAGLDILLVTPNPEKPPVLQGFLEELSNARIGYRLFRKAGALGAEIVRHVREQRNVAFVVIDSLESWGEARSAEPWLQLTCPLVVAQKKSR